MATLLIVTGVIALLVYRFKLKVYEGYNYVGRAAAPVRSRILPVPQRYRSLLQKYFRYYQNLAPSHQRKFEQKLMGFIYAKKFIPRNMPAVPDEMRLFIAATAVQLTFGLSNIYLQHFSKILIYPDDYYSGITKRFHRGEVNPAFGIIVLSWHNFMEGFLHGHDAVNLGLHEMAHALRLENIIRNEEFQFFDENQFDQWAHRICNDMESFSGASFFRPYACSNVHEFFSVSVENFFERSQQFKTQLPELYNILVRLLHQDPLLLHLHASPKN
jgi:hypothetical protein